MKILLLSCLIPLFSLNVIHAEGKSKKVYTYKKHIYPIFKRSCNKCHNEKKQKGKLRLDKLKFAMKGGKNGPALVVGDPEKSLLVKLIKLPEDHDDRMPPKGKPLRNRDLKKIVKWIASGAK